MNKTARVNQRAKSALNKLKMPNPLERSIRLLNIAMGVNPINIGYADKEAVSDNQELDSYIKTRLEIAFQTL